MKLLLGMIDQREKTIVFCATQAHAGLVRDLINQHARSAHPLYCVRVTANDGALGEQHLREFQDNEKTIPTVLTTSQKLTTGVDARNVPEAPKPRPERPDVGPQGEPLPDGSVPLPEPKPEKLVIKLADGKARQIQHMSVTTFWGPDGKPLSPAQFVESLFGTLPEFFKDEDGLRAIWADPSTRKALLHALAEKALAVNRWRTCSGW